MTTAIAKKSSVETVGEWLENERDTITAMIPRNAGLDAKVFILTALNQLKDVRLKECTATSLKQSMIEAAEAGLPPDGMFGHGYIIAYWNSKLEAYEAKFLIGYKGFGVLGMRSRELNMLAAPPYAQAICAGDEFEDRGRSEEPYFRKAPKNRGEVVGAYAVAEFSSGIKRCVYMNREDLDKIRKRSPSQKKNAFGPWTTDEEPMYAKTALRQLFARGDVPVTGSSYKAVMREEIFENPEIDSNMFTPRRKSEMIIDTTATDVPAPSAPAQSDEPPPAPIENGNDEPPAPKETPAEKEPEIVGDVDEGAVWESIKVTLAGEPKEGKKKDGTPYKLFSFKAGKWNQTFSPTVAKKLQRSLDEKVEVQVQREYNKKYDSYTVAAAKL